VQILSHKLVANSLQLAACSLQLAACSLQLRGTRNKEQGMKFEDLEVWKRSSRLCVALYKALSDCRDYGFKDQITRSALSVPSNIAEGYEREGEKERANFLSYAKGSCGELRTQIYIGIEISYLNKEEAKKWIQETKEISSMLHALRKTLLARS
jgi:four helix bundle protein